MLRSLWILGNSENFLVAVEMRLTVLKFISIRSEKHDLKNQ